jgi:hypothetical protein
LSAADQWVLLLKKGKSFFPAPKAARAASIDAFHHHHHHASSLPPGLQDDATSSFWQGFQNAVGNYLESPNSIYASNQTYT